MNQGKRQCLSVLPTPPPTSTWVKWNVKEEGKRVRSWDGPRKWNNPYLTLDPGSSYLVLDFWRPKEGRSPGPSLTEALAKSGASVRNTTQSLFARNSQSGGEEYGDEAERGARCRRKRRYQERLHGWNDVWADPVELSRSKRLEEELVCKGTGHQKTWCVEGLVSCLERLGMKVWEEKWRRRSRKV